MKKISTKLSAVLCAAVALCAMSAATFAAEPADEATLYAAEGATTEVTAEVDATTAEAEEEATTAEAAEGEATEGEAAPAETAPVAEDGKGSPDTGIEGVAGIAGIAVLASGVLLLTGKRSKK